MRITDYKAQKMFDILLQDCFNSVDNDCPDWYQKPRCLPYRTYDYMFALYGHMADNELISAETFKIMIKFPSFKKELHP